jgi:hypothetical protein
MLLMRPVVLCRLVANLGCTWTPSTSPRISWNTSDTDGSDSDASCCNVAIGFVFLSSAANSVVVDKGACWPFRIDCRHDEHIEGLKRRDRYVFGGIGDGN